MMRQRVNPVLAPDQFSIARSLCPEDLDRRVTRYGIYPSLPAPNGVPWSEYVKTHRNRSRSISSFTEALESDHAWYVTRKILLDQWLPVLDHYLPILLFHISNLLREVICLRVLKRVCMQLLMWIYGSIRTYS